MRHPSLHACGVSCGLAFVYSATQIEADQERTVVTSWPCDPEPVHGSDASQFQPGLTISSPVEVWIADLFQARRLVVNSTVDLDGIKLLRYWLVSMAGCVGAQGSLVFWALWMCRQACRSTQCVVQHQALAHSATDVQGVQAAQNQLVGLNA